MIPTERNTAEGDRRSLLDRLTLGVSRVLFNATVDVLGRLQQPALRRDTSWSLISLAAYVGLGAMQAVAVTRHLGPEAYGFVVVLTLGPTVTGWLASLGLTSATMYLAAGTRSVDRLMTSTLVASLILGWAGAALGWIALSAAIDEAPEGMGLALAIGFLLLPMLLIREGHGALLIGRNQIDLYSKVSIAARCASVSVVLVASFFVPATMTYPLVALSQPLSHLIVTAIAYERLRWRWRWDPGSFLEQIRYGTRTHVGRISELGLLRFDQFVIVSTLGARVLGFYAAAVVVSESLVLLANAVATALFGRLAVNRARARYLSALLIGATMVLLSIVAIPPLLFGRPLVLALFGPGFGPTADVLGVLLIASVVQGTGRVAVTALKALGSPLASSVVQLMPLPLNIVLVLAWTPGLGIAGAALASLVSYSAFAVIAVTTVFLRVPPAPASDRPA